MTAPTDLRQDIEDALHDEVGVWLAPDDIIRATNAVLAVLSEHRDAVLAHLGIDRLGCYSPVMDGLTHRDLAQLFGSCGSQHHPVYVDRGRQSPVYARGTENG